MINQKKTAAFYNSNCAMAFPRRDARCATAKSPVSRRELNSRSLHDIGRRLGPRQSTVVPACGVLEEIRKTDPVLQQKVDFLRSARPGAGICELALPARRRDRQRSAFDAELVGFVRLALQMHRARRSRAADKTPLIAILIPRLGVSSSLSPLILYDFLRLRRPGFSGTRCRQPICGA